MSKGTCTNYGQYMMRRNGMELVLPHFLCHVVSPSQVNSKTVSVCVEDTTAGSAVVLTICCRKVQKSGLYVTNNGLR